MATRGRRRLVPLRGLACLCTLALASAASADYRTSEVEGLRITIDSVWASRAAPGYVPLRLDITNLGDARTIEVVGQGSRFFRGSRSSSVAANSVRQVLRLERGDRVRLTLPLPVFADNEHVQFQIREDNRTLDRFTLGVQSRVAARDASALIVADTTTPLGMRALAWLRPVPGRSSSSTVVVTPLPLGARSVTAASAATGPSLDLMLEPARLPTNWLGFTSLRAVFIGPAEWSGLVDAQKTALLTWVGAGGDLILVDGDVNELGVPEHGLTAADGNAALRRYFFGRIHLRTAAAIETDGIAATLAAVEGLHDPFRALPANWSPDWSAAGVRSFRLPIPGIEGVPARAYLFILLLFSVLIGPINYWVLRRRRQQVLVVLTAPLISLAFIVLLAGYAVAVEGFAVYGRAVSFTMLDQVSRFASTRTSASLYAAGMSPSGGLQFPRDVAVFPLGVDGSGTRERLSLDLTGTQRFAGGALPARSPANFEQIGHRPARERLTFTPGADGITVLNGFDARVEALVYRRGDTTYRLAQPLPTGGRGNLMAGAQNEPVPPPDLPDLSKFLPLFQEQPRGTYLAVLNRSPFWDPGVPAIVERGSFHLVFGLTEDVR